MTTKTTHSTRHTGVTKAPRHTGSTVHQAKAHVPRVTKAVSKAHTAARAGHLVIERGTIISYSNTDHTATVQLLGSQANLLGPIPVATSVYSGGSPAGLGCLVVLLDSNNPSDAAIIAVFA